MITKYIKHIAACILCCNLVAALTSCSDYLEIYPENAVPADKYWANKSDVENALYGGYYTLRGAVIDNLIPWGELRAGCVSRSRGTTHLEQFQMRPTDNSLCSWARMYQIVGAANMVLRNAPVARSNDQTYSEQEMNSHLCEAYFLRALAYFYIVRNWRDAPLITEPYETDKETFNVPKSDAATIIRQIKDDLTAAISLKAAKESFETTWETKGRATKWSIYALMADVCLWNSDFDECIQYADMILNSTSTAAPRFMTNANTQGSWFTIFNPGNSAESIFELQWSHEKVEVPAYQTNDLPIIFDDISNDRVYWYSTEMVSNFRNEYLEIINNYGSSQVDIFTRSLYGSLYIGNANIMATTTGYVWKYVGGTSINGKRTTQNYDPNYIIYRVPDVMLMKAEALIMRSMGQSQADNQEAMALVNQIRNRTNLKSIEVHANMGFKELMDNVLYERIMELSAEGKAWYDFLRVGHYKDPSGVIDFKRDFLIEYVVKYNKTPREAWINAVLGNEDAWYLPVADNEIKVNPALTQNPYYM